MTKTEVKAMLKDIIDNGAEYECRSLCGQCDYKRENCDNTCTLTNRLWGKYHLGDEIRSDYEYRKVEKWYVVENSSGGFSIKRDSKFETDPCREFEGSKEVCEKILDEVRKNEGIEQMTKFYIGEIIKDLGVEV